MTTQTKLLQPSKIKMNKSKIYLFLLVGSFLVSFGSYYFIINAQLFTPGLGGISYGLAYVINDIIGTDDKFLDVSNVIIFWIVYILGNIPIIYFTLKWYTKNFFKLSMFFFVTNFIFSMILANVPVFSEQIFSIDKNSESSIEILSLAFFGGLIYGLGTGMTFRVGSCTMGLDPVSKFFSKEKDINIAYVLFAITIISTTIFTIIRFFTNPEIKGTFLQETILSPEYIGTWIFVVTYSLVTGSIYASNKKVEITVKTKKSEEISDFFNSNSYHRGHTLILVEGGYTKQKFKSFEMITNIEEMYDVVEKIAAIDPKAFITINELKKVYDVRDWRSMTDEEIEKSKQIIIKEKEKREKLIKRKNDKISQRKKKNS
ncbi:MAG: YitT family protein [Mycoplasmataceae bacterium]|nr:YitT family protein [Mycoplasmataceae bacterium]